MDESKHNSRIEEIASKITLDKTSLNEQNPQKLQKYYDYVKNRFSLTGEPAVQLVNEAFLFLKLQNADSIDPIKEGDKFGAGFS